MTKSTLKSVLPSNQNLQRLQRLLHRRKTRERISKPFLKRVYSEDEEYERLIHNSARRALRLPQKLKRVLYPAISPGYLGRYKRKRLLVAKDFRRQKKQHTLADIIKFRYNQRSIETETPCVDGAARNTFTAGEFLEFAYALDSIADKYTRPENNHPAIPYPNPEDRCYLVTHLRHAVFNKCDRKDYGCIVSKFAESHKDRHPTVRLPLPTHVVKCMKENKVEWKKDVAKPNVLVSWVVSWLYDVYDNIHQEKIENEEWFTKRYQVPRRDDSMEEAWKSMQLHYKCKNVGCLNHKHYEWKYWNTNVRDIGGPTNNIPIVLPKRSAK